MPLNSPSGPRSSSDHTTQPGAPDLTHAPAGPAAAAPCCGLLRNLASMQPQQRYRFVREVARGGTARVREVWDANLGRRVAMKVSNVRLDDAPDTCLHQCADPRIARFVGEAAVMCHLDHPGVVSVHEIGLDADRRLYFIMSLVTGETLEGVIAKVGERADGWTLNRALSALVGVCETLGYAHSRGVVHRDVKPSNVMLGSHGQVYVMDWGLAHVKGSEPALEGLAGSGAPVEVVLRHADRLTTPEGVLLGTLCYMPWEQADGGAAGRSPRVDVYAVGAMLYHLLSGRAPYADVPRGSVLVRDVLRSRAPRPLGETAPAAPRELVAICEKAMARRPEQRYADMDALARDLRAYLEHRPVTACPTGSIRRLAKWGARNPSTAAWCGVALTLLSALAGVVLAVALGR